MLTIIEAKKRRDEYGHNELDNTLGVQPFMILLRHGQRHEAG